MSFSAPLWLLGLLVLPAVWLVYRVARRRANRYAVRFTAISTLRLAAEGGPDWRRHVQTGLTLAAIAALVIALARPLTTVHVAVKSASVMLVTDHSGSMQAADVAPTRLAAAQRAANTFIDQLPSVVRVGAVAFSSTPDSVQPPSTDHQAARQIIDSQVADGATATGDALALALGLLHLGPKPPPSAIVLLSDGAANAGQDSVAVARQARADKVPIYTVALGTPGATITNPADPFGAPVDVSPDPQLLAQISQVSGGRTFTAQDAGRLGTIYKTLGSQLGSQTRHHEATAAFAIGGLVLLLLAGTSSLRWAGRLP